VLAAADGGDERARSCEYDDSLLDQCVYNSTLHEEISLSFPLINRDAESVPLPDGGFDVAMTGSACWK
jgi:hypothetical protein